MKIRLFHVSDMHGDFPEMWGRGDWVIISGDMMPNRHDEKDPWKPGSQFGVPDREAAFQQEWVTKNLGNFAKWIGKRKAVFSPGNHDYFNPTDLMRSVGIDFTYLGAHDVHHVDGIPFYGFPYCPWDVRPWNWATDVKAMQGHVETMKARLQKEGEAVIVAHCPPAGILDRGRGGTHYGNTSLTNYLAYEAFSVKAVLSGHVHEDHGVTYSGGVIISNAARSVHNLEIEFQD